MCWFIIKYSELTLKGKNKNYFEDKLIKNIKDCLKKNKKSYKSIKKSYNRLIIEAKDCSCLKNVFGIASICRATKTALKTNEIAICALNLAKNLNPNKTFKINTTRANKKFLCTSMDVNRQIGSAILKKTNTKVDLTNPNLEIFVEILDDAYLYTKKIKGYGGLPTGSEGRVISLIEDKASVLASILAMRRGCSIIPVYFKKTSISLLHKYAYGFDLKPIKISSINEIDKIAKQKNAKALVVNQTLQNFTDLPLKTPILRPLISFTNQQIKEMSETFH